MRPLRVVVCQVDVEVLLHLVERFVPLRLAVDAKVLLEERAVEALDETIDPFELRVGPAAVLATVVAEDGRDRGSVPLEERQG